MKQRSYRGTTGKVVMVFAAIALLGALFIPAAFAAHLNTTADLGPSLTGDPDGFGTVDLTFDEAAGVVCYDLDVNNIEPVTVAHIHQGSASQTGPVVVDFDIATNGLSGCVDAEASVIASITDDGEGFYVNVHTAEFPAGAIRAQVGEVTDSTTMSSSTTALTVVSTASTDGDANSDASGSIYLTFDTDTEEVCYELETVGLSSDTTLLHIHQGGTGQEGGVVINLNPGNASPVSESGCVTSTDADVNAVLADEGGHYVNLHTTDAPNGAIRGQVAPTTPLKVSSSNLDGLGFGDPNGTGTAVLTLYPGGDVCFDIEVDNIANPTLAHVHVGAEGATGPVLIDFDIANNGLNGCVESTDDKIESIEAMPSNFYVNIHNDEFPNGAVRGQLTATTDAPDTTKLTLRLDPSGDPDGEGIAMLDLDPATGRVCFDITANGIDTPTVAHIHTGGPGVNGGVVVDLDVPANGTEGCVFASDTDVQTVVDDLQGHYLNVHTAEFPAGAIRQQLQALCNGLEITVDLNVEPAQTPTDGDDVIYGTNGADVIDALDGNDTVCGGGGDDIIQGGVGDDTILGEAGDDTMRGFDGVDIIDGGVGDDRAFGNKGADIMRGGDGNDTLHGNRGADTISGEGGDDRLFGYSQNDTIDGGDGNDRMHGNFGDDTMTGGEGDDRMFGYADNDTIDGGNGNDLIGGNFGDDVIDGEAGDDTLFGSDGDDTVRGGEGNDSVAGNSSNDLVFGDAGDDALDGGIGIDVCDGGADIDSATRCETQIAIP